MICNSGYEKLTVCTSWNLETSQACRPTRHGIAPKEVDTPATTEASVSLSCRLEPRRLHIDKKTSLEASARCSCSN